MRRMRIDPVSLRLFVAVMEEGTIAASFEVTVPRPRRRDSEKLARIAGAVLDRIFASPLTRSGTRPSTTLRAADPEIAALSNAGAKPAHA